MRDSKPSIGLEFDSPPATGFWGGGKVAKDVPWIDRDVELPGRGHLSVREAPGPEGAATLVLLHGLAATGRLNWYTALPALAERFHVVIMDHRGHGSGIRTNHFRLDDCADDTVALADALDIDSFFAVGYSMGGPVAKLCWKRHPDRVRGLVLCSTANHFIRPEARSVASAVIPGIVVGARLMPSFCMNQIVEGMITGVRSPERREEIRKELRGGDPATIMQAARAIIRFSSHDWASDITVPTAVLVTTKDTLVAPDRQFSLAASIRDAKLWKIDADHLACVNATDQFVPALLAACEYVRDEADQRVAETINA